jgi:hypothetical protein
VTRQGSQFIFQAPEFFQEQLHICIPTTSASGSNAKQKMQDVLFFSYSSRDHLSWKNINLHTPKPPHIQSTTSKSNTCLYQTSDLHRHRLDPIPYSEREKCLSSFTKIPYVVKKTWTRSGNRRPNATYAWASPPQLALTP